MRAWPVWAEQIAGVVLMAETKGIVEAEGFDRCHGLDTPATEVAAHFQRMFHRVTIDVPPQFIFALAGEFGIPVVNEVLEQCSLCFVRRVDGFEQAGVGFLVQELFTNPAVGLAAGDYPIKQNVLAFAANQG